MDTPEQAAPQTEIPPIAFITIPLWLYDRAREHLAWSPHPSGVECGEIMGGERDGYLAAIAPATAAEIEKLRAADPPKLPEEKPAEQGAGSSAEDASQLEAARLAALKLASTAQQGAGDGAAAS